MDDIAHRLRERKAELGLSQAALGRAIGLSQASTSRLLRGQTSVTLDQVRPLEQALCWPPGTIAMIAGLSHDADCPVTAALFASGLSWGSVMRVSRVYRDARIAEGLDQIAEFG